jgi:hypothetical protein
MSHDPSPSQPRTRRRWLVLAVVATLLALYGTGLGWLAQRLQDDLGRTLRPAPALDDEQHRSR